VPWRRAWGSLSCPGPRVEKELALKRLVAIPLAPPLERPFSFVRQRQKFRLRAMEELLEFARNYCQVHAGDLPRTDA